MLLILLLTIATITDLRERIIYDRLIISGFVIIGAFRLFFQTESLLNYILTCVGVLVILATIAAATGGRTIGGGDIKLFALIGLAVGWPFFIYIFVLSHIVAALHILLILLFKKDQQRDIAFAPFILIGTVLPYGVSLL